MEAHLRAGIAVFNAGGFHAAHDAWEDRWLGLEVGTDDERFLHGLIQFTAVAHHASTGNREGAVGLARSGQAYLDGLGPRYRGVDLDPVRAYLDALAEDPAAVERESPPALRHDGEAIRPGDLDFEAAAVAAVVLAEAVDAFEESVVEDAVRYARDAIAARGAGRFVALVMDFVADADHRDVIYDRLRARVHRRRGREADVSGLFDE